MKAPNPCPGQADRRASGGSTLLEMAVTMMAALAIASASMAILSQQISFTRMMRQQSFLLEEAPMIDSLLSPMLGRVDSYRIYSDVAGAKSGGPGVTSGGHAILLAYRSTINTYSYGIISGETQTDGTMTIGYYYNNGGWGNKPDWVLSTRASGVEFFVQDGVLRVRLSGPAGEQVTFSGHTQS